MWDTKTSFWCGIRCAIALWCVVVYGSQEEHSIDSCNHVVTMILPCRCEANCKADIYKYHTQLAKMSFDEIFDLTAGVYFNFYNIYISQNTTNKVMWSCNVTTTEHEGEKCKIVSVLRGTLVAPALNYVTSLGICYFVFPEAGRRSCRRQVRNTLRKISWY